MSNIHTELEEQFTKLFEKYHQLGLTWSEIQHVCSGRKTQKKLFYQTFTKWIFFIICIFACLSKVNIFSTFLNAIIGVRCLIPNNFLIWEATRPLSSCEFCRNIIRPIVLPNTTRYEFARYAYSSKPIVITNAFKHWPAYDAFNYTFFKNLYESIEGSYDSVDEECQFLHFKSDFTSIRDVFQMSEDRIFNRNGQKSWYVGWGNCHPDILKAIRKFHPFPHFLPEDTEYPSKEYVFMGYDDGATFHLDFINRLMWQAQIRGSKLWKLMPPPECEGLCSDLSFSVHPGDAVLLDTRVWYHATSIHPGEFSLSIQSEYG